MSRILCPECGTKISDKATKCPHCGFQSADPKRPISEQDKYEMVPIFEYDIEEWKPNCGELSIISYEDNRSFIQYFGKWENIKVKLPAIAEVIGVMAGKDHIMVAKMDSYVKDLIDKGIYRFTIDKQGEILPTIRDADGFVKQVRLEDMALMPNLTQSLNNLSTHAIMAQILDEIEYVGDAIRELHVELQNDRLAMAEGARDKLRQARLIQDAKLREVAILGVIHSATDAKRVLMRNFAQNMLFSFEEQASELISKIGFLPGSELAGELENVLHTNSLIDYTYEKHMTSLADVLSGEITSLLAEIERNYKIYICSMIVGSILICLIGCFIIRQIIKPILQISESAVALSEQRFDIPDIQLKTHDEVAELAEAFNTMKGSINGYILKLNEHSLLQETYLKALQTQINSHFLFNTLNVIIRTAYFEGAPQTIQLLEATTDMLRYSLNKDRRAVSIFQEISFAETYILIQKMRFTEIFSFNLIIDDELDDILIPSFIIQPLIENAIVHGGYNKATHCTILTAVLQLEDGILILVEDDGCGVDKDTLDTIFEKREEDTGGIGLDNLRKRLQLFYHHEDMLKIYSEKDQFFRVEINIRKEQYIWNTES